MHWIGVALILWAAVGTAHADWFEASGPNVRVLTEGSEKNARDLAEKLERFNAAISALRGREPKSPGPANRLTVYLVDNPDVVEKLARRNQVAGFYLPRAGGSLAVVPRTAGNRDDVLALNAQQVLLHEYTHHFMYRHFEAAFPAWLVEGFAEFHATAEFEKDGGVSFGRPPLYRAINLITGYKMPLEQLFQTGVRPLKGNAMDSLYGRGWLLTHYLTFDKARATQLNDYLQRINRGEESLAAARGAFGDLKELERALDRYTRTRLSYTKLGLKEGAVPPVKVRQLDAGESAVMDVHIVSTVGVNREQALKLLPRVRRAAEPFADHALAQAVLAEAEYDAGNYAEAEAAADRSIAADASSRSGLLYQGMARMARALAAADKAPPTLKRVREPLFRANRLDPDDPRPMLTIFDSYASFGLEPPKSVREGVKYAQAVAPEDRRTRALAAMIYLKDGDRANARALIAPLAFDPHADNDSAVRLLAAIDRGEDAAKAALEAGERDGPAS